MSVTHFQEIFNLLTRSELTFRIHCCEHPCRSLLYYSRYYGCLFSDLFFCPMFKMSFTVLIGLSLSNCSMQQEFSLFFYCSLGKVSRYNWISKFCLSICKKCYNCFPTKKYKRKNLFPLAYSSWWLNLYRPKLEFSFQWLFCDLWTAQILTRNLVFLGIPFPFKQCYFSIMIIIYI